MESDFFASVYTSEGDSADHHGSRWYTLVGSINVLSSRKCRTGLWAKNLAKRKRAKSGARLQITPRPPTIYSAWPRAFTGRRRRRDDFIRDLKRRRTYFQLFIARGRALQSWGFIYATNVKKKKKALSRPFSGD